MKKKTVLILGFIAAVIAVVFICWTVETNKPLPQQEVNIFTDSETEEPMILYAQPDIYFEIICENKESKDYQVTDASGNIIKNVIRNTTDGYVIKAPEEGYARGETYTCIIGKNNTFKTEGLEETKTIHFTIEREEIYEVDYKDNVYENENILINDDTIDLTNTEYKTGDILIVTGENGQRAVKIGDVSNGIAQLETPSLLEVFDNFQVYEVESCGSEEIVEQMEEELNGNVTLKQKIIDIFFEDVRAQSPDVSAVCFDVTKMNDGPMKIDVGFDTDKLKFIFTVEWDMKHAWDISINTIFSNSENYVQKSFFTTVKSGTSIELDLLQIANKKKFDELEELLKSDVCLWGVDEENKEGKKELYKTKCGLFFEASIEFEGKISAGYVKQVVQKVNIKYNVDTNVTTVSYGTEGSKDVETTIELSGGVVVDTGLSLKAEFGILDILEASFGGKAGIEMKAYGMMCKYTLKYINNYDDDFKDSYATLNIGIQLKKYAKIYVNLKAGIVEFEREWKTDKVIKRVGFVDIIEDIEEVNFSLEYDKIVIDKIILNTFSTDDGSAIAQENDQYGDMEVFLSVDGTYQKLQKGKDGGNFMISVPNNGIYKAYLKYTDPNGRGIFYKEFYINYQFNKTITYYENGGELPEDAPAPLKQGKASSYRFQQEPATPSRVGTNAQEARKSVTTRFFPPKMIMLS